MKFYAKQYYQINTVSMNAKPISPKRAEKATILKEFIPWYDDGEVIFIADLADDAIDVETIVRKKLNQLGKEFNHEYFYEEF